MIKTVAGVRFDRQAQFNPYKYSNALAQICSGPRMKIFEETKTVDVIDEDDCYIIKTENGAEIKTKYLIITTKYPIINIPGFYFLKMYQSTSYAVGMRTKERIFNGMYINSEKPTISLRMAKDKDGMY